MRPERYYAVTGVYGPTRRAGLFVKSYDSEIPIEFYEDPIEARRRVRELNNHALLRVQVP